jgi:hypothetical protein
VADIGHVYPNTDCCEIVCTIAVLEYGSNPGNPHAITQVLYGLESSGAVLITFGWYNDRLEYLGS